MAITIQNNSNYLKVEEECYSQTTQVQTKKTNQTNNNQQKKSPPTPKQADLSSQHCRMGTQVVADGHPEIFCSPVCQI